MQFQLRIIFKKWVCNKKININFQACSASYATHPPSHRCPILKPYDWLMTDRLIYRFYVNLSLTNSWVNLHYIWFYSYILIYKISQRILWRLPSSSSLVRSFPSFYLCKLFLNQIRWRHGHPIRYINLKQKKRERERERVDNGPDSSGRGWDRDREGVIKKGLKIRKKYFFFVR